MSFIKKFKHKYIWKRFLFERLTEPLHLNIISFFILLFGNYRSKIDFDLIIRSQHAFGLLKAADRALKLGYNSVSVIEFGVASGAGLINIQKIAANIQKHTGVKFNIYGFDNVVGMPPHKDYRDHPDLYKEGDFPMNYELLERNLDKNTTLIIGNIKDNISSFLENLPLDSPIGFVSIDVDYYSSTKDVLTVFESESSKYLDIVYLYFDDIHLEEHNSLCGEKLAINEFNERNRKKIIEKYSFLEAHRIFKHASWLKHIYLLHNLDHWHRNEANNKPNFLMENPYF